MDNIKTDGKALDRKRLPFGIFIQSILVGFYMDIKCISKILGTYGFDENSSIMTLLYIVTITAIFLTGFTNGSYEKLGKSSILILVYIFFSYFITVTFGGQPLVSLPHLAVFTVSAFLIPFISKIDARTTLLAIMLFPLLGINHVGEIFVFVTDWNEWISMGTSYAFYVPIVASIIYLNCYFKDASKIFKAYTFILVAVNMFYLFMIFQFGSRGPITLLFLLVCFLWVVRPPSEYVGITLRKNRLLVGIVFGVILLLLFDQVLLSVDFLLSKIGVSSHTVSKFMALSAEGDISHNRNDIMSIAISGFFDNPILGNGLDCFDQKTGMMYPHNFLLQILYDGGLLLFAILIIPMSSSIIKVFKFCDKEYFGIFSFLLFAGIAGGLFSGDLWKQPLLWMFVGLTLSKSFIYEK